MPDRSPGHSPSRSSGHSLESLKRKLGDAGWRTDMGHGATPLQGTLEEMALAAHGRRKNGQAVGVIEEIATRARLDMFELEQLWQHLGLPTV